MMGAAHISIIGQFAPEFDAHVLTREAVIHAERALGVVVNTRWITPNDLESPGDALSGSCGALIAPRNPLTPRKLWPEILNAMDWLAQHDVPMLALEYGYQHLLLHLARTRLGLKDANSQAYDADTATPFIIRLAHDEEPIDKYKPRELGFTLRPGSRLAAIYDGATTIRESFRAHYVLNPDFAGDLEAAGFPTTAQGMLGGTRFHAAIEAQSETFVVGVAWLPQNKTSSRVPHPLFLRFVEAAIS